MTDALVIGAGPAGLMAAEQLADAGRRVLICDARPSFGRKFLMAGKSGLNLTKDEPFEKFLDHYWEAAPELRPMLSDFDAQAVMNWAKGLGQDIFVGSTGRVFPTSMKASPLLRAWLARLDANEVKRRTRWRWTGWDADKAVFQTPEGPRRIKSKVTVLALGGASWARLGSDGNWTKHLAERGISLAPFQPANAGLVINWTGHMVPSFGQPLKGAAFHAGKHSSRGEAVVSERGLEGGGIYAVSRHIRNGDALLLDLLPDWELGKVKTRLARPRGKASLNNHLRKSLGLGKLQLALLQEFARPLPADPAELAILVKSVPVRHDGLRPLDEAISTAGGVPFSALNEHLMLNDLPGVFCAGEMLDWEAPTGGYLLTACLATGHWAGRAAARYT